MNEFFIYLFIIFFKVVTTESAKIPVMKLLASLGVIPEAESGKQSNLSDCYTVLLDGIVVGRVHQNRAQDLAKQLRYFKASEQYDVCFYYLHLMEKLCCMLL